MAVPGSFLSYFINSITWHMENQIISNFFFWKEPIRPLSGQNQAKANARKPRFQKKRLILREPRRIIKHMQIEARILSVVFL